MRRRELSEESPKKVQCLVQQCFLVVPVGLGISFPSAGPEHPLNRSALLTGRRDRGSSQSHLHCNAMLGFTLAEHIRLRLFLAFFFFFHFSRKILFEAFTHILRLFAIG